MLYLDITLVNATDERRFSNWIEPVDTNDMGDLYRTARP